MAAHPHASAAAQRSGNRWSAHRAQALAVRTVVYAGPIAASIVFVHYAGKAVPAPLSSLWLYLAWWFGLSIAATGVLIAIDRMTRRLLPLAALLQLSLVFPDEAPSRFKVAFKAGDVDRLEARLAARDAAARAATPSEAAARLLELVAALNIHDPLTRGHCDRVRAYAVMIGEELGLSQEDLDLLNWAALLHDVGKLDVPTEILSKDGRPTDEEWQTLRQHPLFGEELAEPMRAWLGTWTSAIGYHHEHWDGRGYPRGLAGAEIPLPGRIVAVADVFDVITSARSYKKASAAADGRAEIARCAGTQFDPDVVRAFLNVSLGRMRLVMGPLSWLAHAPLLGRLPFTPALGTAASVFSVAAATAVGGVAGPAAPRAAAPAPSPAHAVAKPQNPTATKLSRHYVSIRRTRPLPPPRPRPSLPPASIDPGPRIDPVPSVVPPMPALPPSQGAPSPQPTSLPAVPAGHQPPSFAAGPDVTVDEDAGAVSLPWASNVSADPPGSRVRFTVTTGNSSLFSTRPRVTDDGRLQFTPTDNANGVAAAVVTATDALGAQAAHPLQITVAAVNDPPSFSSLADVTAIDDGGPVSVPWATAVSPGPANESSQAVSFSAVADRPDLFTTGGQPVVDDGGLLTFTPAFVPGTTTVTVTARDDGGTARGGLDTKTAIVHITLLPRNHAPTLTVTGAHALEDAGPQSAQVVTAVGPGASDETGQVVTLSLTTDHPELFSTLPALTQAGVLTFTPAADAFGTATATVTAHDDGGTANGGEDTTTATFTITLDPVNDAPSFVSGGNVSVLENAGPQSVSWAGAISAGPPNEAGQTVSFLTVAADPSLFAPGGEPVVASNGTLSFTPAVAASGSTTVTVTAHDDGGTANGGVDSTVATSFTITVTAVNQAPSFTGGGNVTSAEDAGAQNLQWATAISPGPNESSQTVTFSASTTNPALFAAAPAISPSGVLTYTAAPNANGVATVTATAQDDGGTANGGVDTATATFQISVTAVNDAPSFTGAGNQSALEDAGAQTVQWATGISPGPLDESGQLVGLSVASTNPALFLVQPQISPTGVLSYTPAVNANGSSTVTVTAQDDGGTANGGSDTTSQSFTIAVTAVNDAPTFVSGGNQAVLEDAGAQSVQWATSISAGPADEASQNVGFSASNDNNALFSAQPVLDAAGVLTYTPAPNANGTATVSVTAQDNGGTANGGVDTASATFTIAVTAVNDAPSFNAGANQVAAEDSGAQTVSGWASAISAGPTDESTQSLSFTVTNDNNALFSVQPTVDQTGTLSYTPAASAFGTATVTLQVHDDGGTANGGVDASAAQTFSIWIRRPPAPVNDSYQGSILTDIAGNVLDNDTDPDGDITQDSVTLVNDVQHGSLSLSSDGSFLYIPALLYIGPDSFTYRVTSPGGTATGLVNLTVGGANVDTQLVASQSGNDKAAPYQLSSGNFTATSGSVYLVFVGHTAAAGDTPTLSAAGDLTVNGGPITSATMPSVTAAGALNYGWVWEVDGTGGNTSSLTVNFTNPNLKSAGADVIQVVQVDSSASPPYVGAGTVVPPGSSVVTNHSATVQLASPSSSDSEVAFLYVDGDIGGHDPGWSTSGMSTFTGSFFHGAGADGFGSIVGYAPNALSSATTATKFPGVDGISYIAISFELKP